MISTLANEDIASICCRICAILDHPQVGETRQGNENEARAVDLERSRKCKKNLLTEQNFSVVELKWEEKEGYSEDGWLDAWQGLTA